MKKEEKAHQRKRFAWAAGIVGCAVAACLVVALAACSSGSGASDDGGSDGSGAETSTPTAENGTLVVGMELAYPPFETKDADGNPDGVSVQFMKDFGEAYGYDVKIEDISWDGLIPSLQTGKVDCIMSSMTITDEREEAVDFTEPYANAQLALLANKDSGIESIDDLNQEGRTVVVKTGSTGDTYATEHLTNCTITRLSDESACVTEVTQGKADGFIYDQLTIYRNQQANPDTTTAVYIPFQDVEYWGIAVASGNDELREQLNEFIEESKTNGEFDKLTEQYMSEEKAAFDEYGFLWFFDLQDEG